MKITSFSPLIVTTDPENTIKLFEELGFEKRHTKEGLDGREDIVGVRMKDANGFYVDIVKSGKTKQDMTTIRMNVDDFDEGYKFFMDHGFHNALGKDVIVEAEHFKGAHLASPSGFEIMMMKHIRKD